MVKNLRFSQLIIVSQYILLCFFVFFNALVVAQNTEQKEQFLRSKNVIEAQELLIKGDAAYQAGKYAAAVESFSAARSLITNAPETFDLREAATDRYVTAAVQRAKEMSRKGDVESARALMESVLEKDVAPNNVSAKQTLLQLEDPIRTNPAATATLAKDVDEVRRTLYEAQGFFDLGKFDESKSMYEEVLRIDPTNKAARRGMEMVTGKKSNYAEAAYDQTRGEMLTEVESQWELKVPELNSSISGVFNSEAEGNMGGKILLAEKIKRLIIPVIDFEQAGLAEAIDFLRNQAVFLDTDTIEGPDKGVNIVLNIGSNEDAVKQIDSIKFDLRLKNVPLEVALQKICDLTRMQYSLNEFAVNIGSLGSISNDLVGRTYRVPPDFLSGTNSAKSKVEKDPFADRNEANEGLLALKITAKDKLAEFGVSFPEGAAASFNSANSTLFVKNTILNHDIIQQMVDTISQVEPVQVVVRTTIVKVQQTLLEELGFDWLMTGQGMGGNTFLTGGTTGSGDPITDFSASGLVNNTPITAGNRSGNTAITNKSIDQLIQSGTSGFAPSRSRAPGALNLLGKFQDNQISMMFRGLSQKKGVDLMTRPSTVTRSGQTATIEIIREMIYPTEYEPPELPNSISGSTSVTFDPITGIIFNLTSNSGVTPVTPATPTAFETRKIGTVLEVNPIVSADRKFIELSVRPEITQFDGFVNYGSPINAPSSTIEGNPTSITLTDNRILQPIFNIIRANTSVTIADGETIMIGGMIDERVQNVEDKIPVLGDVPLVGRLFQTKALSPVKTAIMIFVNVELQDPSGKCYRDR
jgi:general secretion pathway protein D